MNREMRWVTGLLAGVVLSALPVQAQTVRFNGEKCPVPFQSMVDGEMTDEIVKVPVLQAVGCNELGQVVVIRQDQTISYVERDVLEELVPMLDVESLPVLNNVRDMSVGSNGTAAIQLQELLIEGGYLNGVADGAYGRGTAGAVAAFQEKAGLEATGNADSLTQWLLAEEVSGTAGEMEVVYPPVFTVEEKFAEIYQETDANLTEFLRSSWKFRYDVFSGSGVLDPKVVVGTIESAEDARPIDQIRIEADARVNVERDIQGILTLTPVIRVYTEGAFAIYPQNLVIRRGSSTAVLEAGAVKRYVDGIRICEEACFQVTREASDLIYDDTKPALQIAIQCPSEQYELSVVPDVTDLQNFMVDCENAGIL